MPRFYGNVGYASKTVETKPGIWENVVVERPYFGDVLRNSRALSSDDKVNADIRVGNSISIVADPYANQHFFDIQYVWWQGARWIVSNVEVERPRLILRLGGLYHGEPATAEQPPENNGDD